MMKISVVVPVATFVLAGLALAPTSATAAPPSTVRGCPASFELITVAAAVEAGYTSTPPAVDHNADGIVCRLPYSEVVRQATCGPACPVPVLYNWIDNNVV